MKKAGIIIAIIGLLIFLVTGFRFITKEKVVDIGNLEITRDKTHSLTWPPVVGVVVMAIGGGIFLLGLKKK